MDTQTDYLRNFLNFLGITDNRFIYAKGLNMSTQNQEIVMSQVRKQMAELID